MGRAAKNPHEVAELLGALKLIVLEPLLHELAAALLQHRPRQLHRLHLVQLALGEQDGEVLQHRLRLWPRQLPDCLPSPDCPLQ